jgi:hypothetical protein
MKGPAPRVLIVDAAFFDSCEFWFLYSPPESSLWGAWSSEHGSFFRLRLAEPLSASHEFDDDGPGSRNEARLYAGPRGDRERERVRARRGERVHESGGPVRLHGLGPDGRTRLA